MVVIEVGEFVKFRLRMIYSFGLYKFLENSLVFESCVDILVVIFGRLMDYLKSIFGFIVEYF